jgi:hypothetical protein
MTRNTYTQIADTFTTTQIRDDLIRMFLDGSSGEVYNKGRLATVSTENATHLVAYGNEIIAKNEGGDITIYTGHHGTVSQTVTTYIKRVGSVLNDTETRNVQIARAESPTMGIGARASDSAKYIGHFVGKLLRSAEDFSSVEKDARKEVNMALLRRMDQIFN